MAKKTGPDLDKRMLSLTQIGVWVGILGLMTAVILGYLQIRGGNQPPPVTKETKTIIYVIDSAGHRVPKEVQSTTSTQGAVTAGSHRAATSGAKTTSETTHETTKPAETKPAEPAKPSGESTTTATTPEPGTFKPRPELTPLRPRFPGGFHVITPTNTAGSSGTSTATTPLKRDIRIRKDLYRINP